MIDSKEVSQGSHQRPS